MRKLCTKSICICSKKTAREALLLSLNPLPPAKRKEIPAVLAMGLSFLLHGVLVVSLLAAALALPDYLPVQSGGVLTVSWLLREPDRR